MRDRIARDNALDYARREMRLTPAEGETLRSLAESAQLDDRRLFFRWAHPTSYVAANHPLLMELLEANCFAPWVEIRWQASHDLGRYAQTHPERAWAVVERGAASADRDVRDAAAVNLLVPLLSPGFTGPDRFPEYFREVSRRIEAGDERMLEMLTTPASALGFSPTARTGSLDRLEQVAVLLRAHGVPEQSVPHTRSRPASDLRVGRRVVEGDPDDYYRVRFMREEQQYLRTLTQRPDFAGPNLCLDWLDRGQPVRANRRLALELLEIIASNPRERLRWQALSMVSHYLHEDPEGLHRRMWSLLLRLGDTPIPDLRSALSVYLLEALLKFQADRYWPLVKRRIEAGDEAMLEMLRGSYVLGRAILVYPEIHAVLTAHGEPNLRPPASAEERAAAVEEWEAEDRREREEAAELEALRKTSSEEYVPRLLGSISASTTRLQESPGRMKRRRGDQS